MIVFLFNIEIKTYKLFTKCAWHQSHIIHATDGRSVYKLQSSFGFPQVHDRIQIYTHLEREELSGLFTVRVYVSNCDIANK